MKKSIRSNILLSVVAQVISLCASFLLGLIVPKFLEINEYAYWQTFLLYSSYVGILNYGLIDGIVLRYAQYDYDELNKPLIRSQLVCLMVLTTTAALICCCASVFISDSSSKLVCILVGVNIIITNLVFYTTYIYQITNEIPKYITVIIVERLTNVLFVVIFLLTDLKDFYWYCIAQIIGSCVGILFAVIKSRDLFLGTLTSIKNAFSEFKVNISAGIKLLIANWSAMFIVGGAKTFIQWHWSLIIFGFISFAFSLSNLFLSFVTSTSVVLFPTLKRFTQEKLNHLYPKLRMQMTVLLISLMILYYPIEYLLPLWMPKYTYSLKYFGMILPVVVFTSKLTLLTNNYLKVFRQEKAMLTINVFTLILALTGYAVGSYVFDNLEFIIYWTVIVIILRSILSEIKLTKILDMNWKFETIAELAMCLVFSISLYIESQILGASVYFGALVTYLLINLVSKKKRNLLLRIR